MAVQITGAVPADARGGRNSIIDASGNFWQFGFDASDHVCAWKSTNAAASFDAGHASSTVYSHNSLDVAYDGSDTVHVLVQDASHVLQILTFTLSTTTWADAYVSGTKPTVQPDVSSRYNAFIVLRSTGERVCFFQGPLHNTTRRSCYYAHMTSSGAWAAAIQVDGNIGTVSYSARNAYLGTSDRVHFIFVHSNSQGQHRSISSGNTIDTAQNIGNAGDVAETTVGGSAYDPAVGMIWGYNSAAVSVRFPWRATEGTNPTYAVDSNAVDSSAGLTNHTAFLVFGGVLYAFFVGASNDIYYNIASGTTWGTSTLQETATSPTDVHAVADSGTIYYTYADGGGIFVGALVFTVNKSDTDANGTTTEGSSLAAAEPSTDANSTTTEVTALLLAASDVGSASEGTATERVFVTSSDAGSGTESNLFVAVTAVTDSGTDAESGSPTLVLSSADVASDAESAAATFSQTSSDSAAGSDGTSSLVRVASDTGTATETNVGGAISTVTDVGTLAENTSTKLSGADVGSDAEVQTAAQAFSVSDIGAGTEGTASTNQAHIQSDAGTDSESAGAAQMATATDIGAGAETFPTLHVAQIVGDVNNSGEASILGGPATNTFTSNTTGESGKIQSNPNAAYGSVTAGAASTADITPSRSLSGGLFSIQDGLVRFDTSALDDAAPLGSAQLKLFLDSKVDTDGRNLLIEYFDMAAAIDAADWSHDAPTTGGPPPIAAAFGFESGAGQAGVSPFNGLQARNGGNPYDGAGVAGTNNVRNFGTGARVVDAATADTGSAYYKLMLEAARTDGGTGRFYGPPLVLTGTLTNGSATITNVDTRGLTPQAGLGEQMPVVANPSYLPAGTKTTGVTVVGASGSVTLTGAATIPGGGSATVTLTFDRPAALSRLDRAQMNTKGGLYPQTPLDRPARPDGSPGGYALAFRVNSWPASICASGEAPGLGITILEPAYQGRGAGQDGPLMLRMLDLGLGGPTMIISFFAGSLATNSSTYPYDSQHVNGFNGNPVPSMHVIPVMQLGVWYEIAFFIVWATDPNVAQIRIEYRRKGDSAWTAGFVMNTGVAPTVQWITANGYQDSGFDILAAYRKYICTGSAQSPAWELWCDTFDNGYTSPINSIADIKNRFATSGGSSSFQTVPLSSLTAGWNTINLNDLTGISKTGKTGFRLHIDGGQPTGVNQAVFESSAGANDPQLVVTPAGGTATLIYVDDEGSGTESLSSAGAQQQVSDVGSGVEGLATARQQLAASESGQGIESAAMGRVVVDANVGVSEVAGLNFSSADLGTLAEVSALKLKPAAESNTMTENALISPAASVDTGTGTETQSGTPTATSTDVGSMTEASLLLLTTQDNATAAESTTQAAIIVVPSPENGASTENSLGPFVFQVQANDSGTGTDIGNMVASESDADSAAASDQSTIIISRVSSDAGASTDAISQISLSTQTELGTVAETISTAVNFFDADVAQSDDEADANPSTSDSDIGDVTELQFAYSLIVDLELGLMADSALALTNQFHDSDFMIATEVEAVNHGVVADETGNLQTEVSTLVASIASDESVLVSELGAAVSDTVSYMPVISTGVVGQQETGVSMRPQKGRVRR